MQIMQGIKSSAISIGNGIASISNGACLIAETLLGLNSPQVERSEPRSTREALIRDWEALGSHFGPTTRRIISEEKAKQK